MPIASPVYVSWLHWLPFFFLTSLILLPPFIIPLFSPFPSSTWVQTISSASHFSWFFPYLVALLLLWFLTSFLLIQTIVMYFIPDITSCSLVFSCVIPHAVTLLLWSRCFLINASILLHSPFFFSCFIRLWNNCCCGSAGGCAIKLVYFNGQMLHEPFVYITSTLTKHEFGMQNFPN